MLFAKTTKDHFSNFDKVLEDDKNFALISRSPFARLGNMDLSLTKLAFNKTSIESWNYQEVIDDIFEQKRLFQGSRNDAKLVEKLKEDIKKVIGTSFEMSCEHRPHEVSLSCISGVPCTKLHADFLPLRLICTYVGLGTIFLPKESTRYPCLNEGRANKRVLIKGKPSFQANPFDILLLKGRKFNKGEMKPCAHRSPEVSEGEQRLVLKVDFK